MLIIRIFYNVDMSSQKMWALRYTSVYHSFSIPIKIQELGKSGLLVQLSWTSPADYNSTVGSPELPSGCRWGVEIVDGETSLVNTVNRNVCLAGIVDYLLRDCGMELHRWVFVHGEIW